MTGGKSSQSITMLIQVVLSGYLFLNGYCHLVAFWSYRPSSSKMCSQDTNKCVINDSTLGVRFLQVNLYNKLNCYFQKNVK